MPDSQCVRCGRQDSSPANFLLTCSECAKKWHHRCHIPPLQEAELMARVGASLKNDIDNGLEGWICRRCLKKQKSKQGGPGTAPRPQSKPAVSAPAPAPAQNAGQVLADPEIVELVEERRAEKPAEVPSQPTPSLPNMFQPYARPLHMQEASSSVFNPKPHALQTNRASGQHHRSQMHPLPPRPATPQGAGRLSGSRQDTSEKSGTKSNLVPARRDATPGPSSYRENLPSTMPGTPDRPRHNDDTRRSTVQLLRKIPDTRPTNDSPTACAEPRPAAPEIPRDSSGMPNFRAIISTLHASGKLDLPNDLTRAAPTPAPAEPTPPADEDYDVEDLYWPPRPRVRPPEASLPTPVSSARRSPTPEPPVNGEKNRAMLPIQWMQANRGEDSHMIQTIRACQRLSLRSEDAPRWPRKVEARKLSKKERKKKAMEFCIASDQ